MRRIITLAMALLLGSAGCWAQLTFPALSTNNIFTGTNSFQAVTATSATVTGLTPGQCVQVGTGGLLATSGSACGSGGGGITGSGTNGTLPIWTGTSSLGNSLFLASSSALTFTGGDLLFTTVNSSGASGTISIQGASSLGVSNAGGVQIAGGAGSGVASGGSIVLGSGNSSGTAGSFGGSMTIKGGSAPGGAGTALYQPTLTLSANGSGPTFAMKDDAISNGSVNFTNSVSNGVIWRTGNGVPSFNCGTPTIFFRADAPSVSTLIYLCISSTSWTAITVP